MWIKLKPLALVVGKIRRVRVAPKIDLLAQLDRDRLLRALVAVLPAATLPSVLLIALQFFLGESEVQDVGVTVQCAQDVPW